MKKEVAGLKRRTMTRIVEKLGASGHGLCKTGIAGKTGHRKPSIW